MSLLDERQRPAARRDPEAPRSIGLLPTVRARGPVRGRAALLGPALVAAIAYVDPGNFATNIQAGATEGYGLLWVVVLASVIAMLVQYLSAKLGMATGRNLAEQCRESSSPWVNRFMWVQAEAIAIATDLAEFVGAALGLNLLFGVPLPVAGILTAIASFAVLAVSAHGRRKFEAAIAALLILVVGGFVYDVIAVGGQDAGALVGGLAPSLGSSSALAIAVGIVGATVMPHAIYLHSALTQQRVTARTVEERRQLLKYIRIDCIGGLGIAGLTNALMLVLAAALFTGTVDLETATITNTHERLGQVVGGGAALAFAVALLSSGIASASVGTYTGQVVMRGFINVTLPLFVRRSITMLPALAVLCLGLPVTTTLTVSQIVLSFGIPFALIPLLLFTRNRKLMGELVNAPLTTAVSVAACSVIIGLNLYLLSEFVL